MTQIIRSNVFISLFNDEIHVFFLYKIDKNAQGIYVTFPQMGSFEIIFMNKVFFSILSFIFVIFYRKYSAN